MRGDTPTRIRNKRGTFTSAEREKMFRADQREKLRKLRAELKNARTDKARALKLISKGCQAKREDIKTRCRLDREQARAQGYKVMDEREAKLREEREAQKQMRHWTQKERRQRVSAKERKAESAEEVARNIDPEFLPVWEAMKGKIKKGTHSSRTEAFEQWMHDHPGEVLDIVAAAAEDVSDWLAEEESYYKMANPKKNPKGWSVHRQGLVTDKDSWAQGFIAGWKDAAKAKQHTTPAKAWSSAKGRRWGVDYQRGYGAYLDWKAGAYAGEAVKDALILGLIKDIKRHVNKRPPITRKSPAKQPNPRGHAMPPKTVWLGSPLDLWVRFRNTITHYNERDLKGFVMLTTPGAEDLAPGRARLFLVLPRKIHANGQSFGAGAATFQSWHERHPKAVLQYTGLPDLMGCRLGRADRIDYRSNKWGGRNMDYTHNFLEGAPPLVYVDKKTGQPRGFCLTGGSMRITRHGIE